MRLAVLVTELLPQLHPRDAVARRDPHPGQLVREPGVRFARREMAKRPEDRLLTFDEFHHFMRVLAALAATVDLQQQIDAAIPEWPMQ